MAAYGSIKMKRKDLDEVSDEFSDFSLSSPARKIRRLDAELPPILEEEEPEMMPLAFERSEGSASELEDFSHVPLNEERAIVLFKPVNAPSFQSHSQISVSVDSDIISGFKNFWSSSHSNCLRSVEKEEATQDSCSRENLAVVPWVPSHVSRTLSSTEASTAEAPELMETEEMGGTNMEIENNDLSAGHEQSHDFGGLRGAEVLSQFPQQQQQQHCMTTLPPQAMSTPIHWYQ